MLAETPPRGAIARKWRLPDARISTKTASDRWAQFLTGPIQFDESEEYLAFRFRMLAALALAGVLATLLFIAGEASGANPIDLRHQRMMVIFTLGSLLLWGLLRGHKQRFRLVAWVYLALSLTEAFSSLLFVNRDELRILWVYVTVPATYLILGRRAGLAVALLCFAGLVALNPVLERPYSPNAMATALAALAYLSFLFHVHNARAVSYFKRMREYNAHLQERASIDPLTGVMNARAYYAACEHWLDGARRAGAECTVLFVDLDHFKRVNDEHGHAAGDAVLQAVAAALQAGLRRSDLLGRIGGEEFRCSCRSPAAIRPRCWRRSCAGPSRPWLRRHRPDRCTSPRASAWLAGRCLRTPWPTSSAAQTPRCTRPRRRAETGCRGCRPSVHPKAVLRAWPPRFPTIVR